MMPRFRFALVVVTALAAAAGAHANDVAASATALPGCVRPVTLGELNAIGPLDDPPAGEKAPAQTPER